MTLPLSFGFSSCHKIRMYRWSPKKLNVRSKQQLSWKMMVHGVFMLIWGIWNFKIRYIANVISCGFATPRDSAEIDILLKALLVPVWTVTCSYIILCMQQLHQYASLSSKVYDTAYESLPESIVNGNGQAEPKIRIHIWLYDWSDFHTKKTYELTKYSMTLNSHDSLSRVIKILFLRSKLSSAVVRIWNRISQRGP